MQPENNSNDSAQLSSDQQVNDNGYISNPFKVFSHAIDMIKSHNRGVLYRLLMLVVVYFIINTSITAGLEDGSLLMFGATIIGLFISAYITVMFIRYAIATNRSETIDLASLIKTANSQWLSMLALLLLVGLLLAVGMLALVIPALLFMYWFALSPYVLVDKGIGPIQALKQSRELVRGKFWEIAGLAATHVNLFFTLPMLITGSLLILIIATSGGLRGILVFALLGVVLIIVPYLLILIFASYIAWAYRYDSAQILTEMQQEKPPTHKANYISVTTAVLSIVIFISLMLAIFITAALKVDFSFI